MHCQGFEQIFLSQPSKFSKEMEEKKVKEISLLVQSVLANVHDGLREGQSKTKTATGRTNVRTLPWQVPGGCERQQRRKATTWSVVACQSRCISGPSKGSPLLLAENVLPRYNSQSASAVYVYVNEWTTQMKQKRDDAETMGLSLAKQGGLAYNSSIPRYLKPGMPWQLLRLSRQLIETSKRNNLRGPLVKVFQYLVETT